MYFTKFLHEGQGTFSLTNCLEKIPVEIANTQLSFVPFNVELQGEKPEDRTWSGSVDSSGKFQGEGTLRFANGDVYIGSMTDDKRCGTG